MINFPFTILALAEFNPLEKKHWEESPTEVNRQNLDQVIANAKLSIPIDIFLNQNKFSFFIDIREFKHFHPDTLLKSQQPLKKLWEALEFIKKTKLPPREIQKKLQKLYGIYVEFEESQKKNLKKGTSLIDEILQKVALPEDMSFSQSCQVQIENQIKLILEEIYKNKIFKCAEIVWRSLKFLLSLASNNILIKVINTDKGSLIDVLENLLPYLIKNPPSIILIDFPFKASSYDIEVLEKIASIAETILVPIIAWVDKEFFFLKTWDEFDHLPYLPHLFETDSYIKWRQFQKTTKANWIALGCNEFLLRYPYGPDNPLSVSFVEKNSYLWASPVWAIAALIIKSFIKNGWPTVFSSKQTEIENLPLRIIDNYASPLKKPFSEERIWQLTKSHLIPLCGILNKDKLFILADPTCGSTSLSYQLFISRIIQFLLLWKEKVEGKIKFNQASQRLKQDFYKFWEKTGHFPPEIEISEFSEKQILKIKIMPPYEILSYNKIIELELPW